MWRVFWCVSFLFFCFASGIDLSVARGQEGQVEASAPNTLLRVNGDVQHALQLNSTDLASLSRYTASVTDHDGTEATFAGPPLVEILQRAGVKLGEQLRGRELTTYVLVKAADNYQVVFAVAELDPGFTDRVIFLADQC